MLTPPAGVDPAAVQEAVRSTWDSSVAAVEHLPVGFGAHHWRAGSLFVTLDELGARHTAASLEAAYAGAASLDLPFVIACVRSGAGTRTVPFGTGALSATPWTEGVRPPDSSPAVPLVTALHSAVPPPGLPLWTPLVPPALEPLVARPWTGGPYGEAARALVTRHLDDLAGWSARYLALAAAARERPWVATHGEPHERNLMLTEVGARLVDWESLKLAPAERDLRTLGLPGEPDMLELFDLDWRLDEVGQYAVWFAGPHGDSEDDRTAYAGLCEELTVAKDTDGYPRVPR